MYASQSFGGANRGPASQRPRRRSNIFVDIGTIALLVVCVGIVAFQYLPVLSTTGYNVARGQLQSADIFGDTHSNYSYSSRRGRALVSTLRSKFSFTSSGRTYHVTSYSVPVCTIAGLDLLELTDKANRDGLIVRYDPQNPNNCVAMEVIDCYTKAASCTYVGVFFIGLIMLTLAGMSNLSGEKWRPGMRTDAF